MGDHGGSRAVGGVGSDDLGGVEHGLISPGRGTSGERGDDHGGGTHVDFGYLLRLVDTDGDLFGVRW